ncbi:MAG TPA: hypothetical protein VGH74_19850 [Planctomycetaceae bacterium]|jgi:hypothetical protein
MDQLTEFLSSPLGLVAAGVAAFLIGSMIFNVKQWEAHWKQWAIDTSKAMSKAGLVHTPKLLDSLAVGDLAGAFQEIKGLADVFKDPKQLAAEFQTVFQNMLNAAFADPTQAKALAQLANDAVAAFASGDPAKSAGQLAADAQAVASGNPLFSSMAQNGLQLPGLPLNGLALPGLSLVSQLAGHPVLSQIAGALGQAGLGHLFPLVAAGVTNGPSSNVSTTAATQPAPTAVTTSLPSVPAGHVVTIAGPAGAAPAVPAAAQPAAA